MQNTFDQTKGTIEQTPVRPSKKRKPSSGDQNVVSHFAHDPGQSLITWWLNGTYTNRAFYPTKRIEMRIIDEPQENNFPVNLQVPIIKFTLINHSIKVDGERVKEKTVKTVKIIGPNGIEKCCIKPDKYEIVDDTAEFHFYNKQDTTKKPLKLICEHKNVQEFKEERFDAEDVEKEFKCEFISMKSKANNLAMKLEMEKVADSLVLSISVADVDMMLQYTCNIKELVLDDSKLKFHGYTVLLNGQGFEQATNFIKEVVAQSHY